MKDLRTGSREPPGTLELATVETITISRSEGIREEVVFLGPSESSGHGALSVEIAAARTEAGREMGMSVYTFTPSGLLSSLVSCWCLLLAKSILKLEVRDLQATVIEVSFREYREGQEKLDNGSGRMQGQVENNYQDVQISSIL